MKILLLVLLAASLAANGVLALRQRPPAAPVSSGSEPSGAAAEKTVSGNQALAAGSAAAPPAGAPAPAGPAPHAWKPVVSEGDLHRLVADLRAAGYPPAVTRAVINQLLNDRFAGRQPGANAPFWQQTASHPEAVAARSALNQERQALFESLLGDEARPSAILDETLRHRRYGAMSDEKIDAIARIERDYGELGAEAWAKRRNNSTASAETHLQIQQLMEAEKAAEIGALLTPDELYQYEMRTSPSARTLMNHLRQVDVTESEYTRLYAAQTAFDAANPPRASLDSAALAQRQTDQLVLHEQAKSVLGDERFYPYLESADRIYANIAQTLGKFPSSSPATSYRVYQMQLELQSALTRMNRGGPPSPEAVAQTRATVQTYNQQLEQLVGPEAAAAYRKEGTGRIFSTFRGAPAGPPGSGR